MHKKGSSTLEKVLNIIKEDSMEIFGRCASFCSVTCGDVTGTVHTREADIGGKHAPSLKADLAPSLQLQLSTSQQAILPMC
jgi:hypothetical protein